MIEETDENFEEAFAIPSQSVSLNGSSEKMGFPGGGGRGGIACSDDGCHALTQSEGEALWERAKAYERERNERLPDEQTTVRAMFDAFNRLKDFGWRDAIYCPKDGTIFHAIEAGSTGIHKCYYSGAWPDGSWWIIDGDTWPSRPVLFREIPPESHNAKPDTKSFEVPQ